MNTFRHEKLTTITFIYSILQSNARNRDLCCRRRRWQWQEKCNRTARKERKEQIKLIKVVVRRGIFSLHCEERNRERKSVLELHDFKHFSFSFNSWVSWMSWRKIQNIHSHDQWFHAQLRALAQSYPYKVKCVSVCVYKWDVLVRLWSRAANQTNHLRHFNP